MFLKCCVGGGWGWGVGYHKIIWYNWGWGVGVGVLQANLV